MFFFVLLLFFYQKKINFYLKNEYFSFIYFKFNFKYYYKF